MEDELSVWREHLENLGGVKFSKDNIEKGDIILHRRFGIVERVSEKSVTVWNYVTSSTGRVMYSDIKRVVKKGEGEYERLLAVLEDIREKRGRKNETE